MQVLEMAQGAPTASDFERAVLAELAAGVGADVGFMGLKDGPPSAMGLDPAGIHRLQLAKGAQYAAELAPVKRAALEGQCAVVDTAVLGEARVRGLHYFRDLAAPVGGRHSLYALLPLRGEVIGGLVLGRTGSTFRPAEIAQVSGALVALGIARASYSAPRPPPPPLPLAPAPFWRPGALGRARSLDGQELVVRDRGRYREMVARRGEAEMIWTRVERSDPTRSGWPYVELFHLAAVAAGRRERALFIGCGGAVAPFQFAHTYPGIHIDIVEPEPAVVELARSHFRLDALPRSRVHIADGVGFVAAAPAQSWDVVIVDAYDARDIPCDMLEPGFLRALARILRPGGAVAFNIIGTLAPGGSTQAFARAAHEVFEDVRRVPVTELDEEGSAHARRNVVVVCSKLRQIRGAGGSSAEEGA